MSKPLGMKSYGSIPHLPGSRMGPGDHHCHDGQDRIATVKTRDKHDRIVVQEKLDGSNVCAAKVGGVVLPLTRAGYHANTSPYAQHHKFAAWVNENYTRFDAILAEGERLCGEWLYQAHGTRYDLIHEPFVAFDLIASTVRLPFDAFRDRLEGRFVTAKILHIGGALSVADAMREMGQFGWHGAVDPVEGAVWRIERKGKVDFLCKYVRPDKKDGIYLPEVSGQSEVINRWPGRELSET